MWNIIKFTVMMTGEVKDSDIVPYCNELLHALLSDKAQCFMDLDSDRKVRAVLITRILFDKNTNSEYLFMQSLYGFKLIPEDEFRQGFKLLLEFAKNRKCSSISFNSRNRRLWDYADKYGFKEKYRTYEFIVNGGV